MASMRRPPEVDIHLCKTKNLPKSSVPWGNIQLPIDILLLTVKECEFLSCLSYLNPEFQKSYHQTLGFVYFGDIGENEEIKLKIAVIKCNEGSTVPGGSVVVVKNAVVALRPKAVFSVGYCGSLNGGIAKLGDVVISAKLITYAPAKVTECGIQERGHSLPLKRNLANLIKSAGEGWEAPLQNPRELDVTVHRNGVFLSGPEKVQNQDRCAQLIQRFPEAVAIEIEGEGLYAAAHGLEIEWIIIKAISDYADGNNSETDSWRRFASVMAASLTADILSDPIVFQSWPHYGGEYAGHRRVKQSAKASTSTGLEDPVSRGTGEFVEQRRVEQVSRELQSSGLRDPMTRGAGVLPANIKDNSSSTVTNEGGVVDGEGFKLVVPPGAVDKPVLVNITLEDPFKYYRVLVRKDLQNDVMFGAPIINLGPNDQVFKIPVTLTTRFTVNDFNREDVIILHGTESKDGKITWEDITRNSKIDEAMEEVTTQMQHFSTRLVLIRRTWICIKYIVFRLNWMAFDYTLDVLVKKNNGDEKHELALLFMSQDVHDEEFYRERPETSALVQLKNEGFSKLEIPSDPQEENKIYSNESLQVSVRLGEDYKLADSEHQSMSLTIEPEVWWNSGLVKKLKLDATKGVRFLLAEITVKRENGHATVRSFRESGQCGHVRSLLDVEGATVFNVTPIARLVNMPETSVIQIPKFWKSEDKQLDMIMKYWRKENTEFDYLATLNKKLKGLKQEDYKVTKRGEMHIRNLRKLTSQTSKCENDDCKTKYFSREIPALFEMVSSDCVIESEGSAEYFERVESMNKTYQQKCSSSTSESITEWFPTIVPDVIQKIKEIFVDEGVGDVHNGLRGLSKETLSQFPPKIRDAQQNNSVQQLVCIIGSILELLCRENSGKQSTAQIECWGERLALFEILDFLKPFFKHCLQDLRLHMRLKRLSHLLKKIMGGLEDDFLVLDVCNVARSLINFAEFVPSKLVRFQLNDSTNSPVTCNGEIVQYDKSCDEYYQWFNITKESEEELQLHATASVYADGLGLTESGLNKFTQFYTIHTVTAKAGSIVDLKLVYVWGSEKVDVVQVHKDPSEEEESSVSQLKRELPCSSLHNAKRRKISGEYVEHRRAEQSARASTSTGLEQDPVSRGRATMKEIKDGVAEDDDLEGLSRNLGDSWDDVARRLNFNDAEITAFHKENEKYAKKALQMLIRWKEKYASEATYRVLYTALCHEYVNRKDLAEKFCCK